MEKKFKEVLIKAAIEAKEMLPLKILNILVCNANKDGVTDMMQAEICKMTGIRQANVAKSITALQKSGYIKKEKVGHRVIYKIAV